ncbi:MAG: sugar phosphate nucleotidyltransferase, partial [Candidatus Pacebacteria bacterium]|nr:sugar phosphate nucleotidyltransferase [Candidatus Paceibacterota bacterium]
MQAIILAAGNGTRFYPLSLTKPKPLFSLFGKSILEHNLEQLKGIVDEVFLIVNYKAEQIKEVLGNDYQGIKINYIFQESLDGTGSAALLCKKFIKDRFLLLNGDDFYFSDDIKCLLASFPSVLVKKHDNPSSFGVINIEGNLIKDIVEKPKKPTSDLVNTGMYYVSKEIFTYKVEKSSRGEYEFTDFLKNLINREEVYYYIANNWFPASYPWDILNSFEHLFEGIRSSFPNTKHTIESNATIKGNVLIDEGALIKGGAYIEGPVYIGKNCIIGPNCYIRSGTSLEDDVEIGQSVEINRSIVGKNTNIKHLSYVGDSIIGENCNLGAGTIVANLRHDGDNVKTKVKDTLVDTGRKKFGTIIGDGAKLGVGTIIYPGKKIWPNMKTLPGDKIQMDLDN